MELFVAKGTMCLLYLNIH